MEELTPSDPTRPCDECVLQSGPCCLDKSYCEFRKTGKTWKKSLDATSPGKREAVQPSILVVGDSWAAGHEAESQEDRGWPEIMGIPQSHRQGICGSTAAQWAHNMDGRLTRARDTKADVAIVSLLGNDFIAALGDGNLQQQQGRDGGSGPCHSLVPGCRHRLVRETGEKSEEACWEEEMSLRHNAPKIPECGSRRVVPHVEYSTVFECHCGAKIEHRHGCSSKPRELDYPGGGIVPSIGARFFLGGIWAGWSIVPGAIACPKCLLKMSAGHFHRMRKKWFTKRSKEAKATSLRHSK
jgi:hypothetical protein